MRCMELKSLEFEANQPIPKRFGRDFDNTNPPLEWLNTPADVQSLVLIMEDPDVPKAAGVPVWDHWIVWNIPGDLRQIPERWQIQGVSGKGTRGELEYGGPRPPDREHRYFFRLYALDSYLDLKEGEVKSMLVEAMSGHILAEAELMGTFAP